MIERAAPLRAQWVKVADRDGHVRLERRWVVVTPTGQDDKATVTASKHAA
jgi:hypothetical protein